MTDKKNWIKTSIIPVLLTAALMGVGSLVWQAIKFSNTYSKDKENLAKANELQDKNILNLRETMKQEFEYAWKDIDKHTEELKMIRNDSNDIKVEMGKMGTNIVNIKDGINDIKKSIELIRNK